MEIDVGCTFVFEVPATTHAVLMVEPHSCEVDRVRGSRLDVVPGTLSSSHVDGFGNRARRLTLEPGRAQIDYVARLDSSPDVDVVDDRARILSPQELPSAVLPFLLPSRYCESDRLADAAWSQFGTTPATWSRVQAISDWVHEHVHFDYGSSSPLHSAASVLQGGVGVCRDFTHLAIAMCRALNIPARYVFGYLPDIGVPDPGTPMDFCAWMEVYVGDRWYVLDPRNNERRIGRVVIGRGRDAADVAMVTSFGPVQLVNMTVRAEIGEGESWSTAVSDPQMSHAH